MSASFEPPFKNRLCNTRPTKTQISMRTLISAFVVRCLDNMILLVDIFEISSLLAFDDDGADFKDMSSSKSLSLSGKVLSFSISCVFYNIWNI